MYIYVYVYIYDLCCQHSQVKCPTFIDEGYQQQPIDIRQCLMG